MLKKLKFNTIFWKIFLSFWLAMILIMVTSVFTVGLLKDRDHMAKRDRLTETYRGIVAVTIYESGGRKAFRHWLRKNHRFLDHVFLLDKDHQDVLDRTIPGGVAERLAKGEMQFRLRDDRHSWKVRPVYGSEGNQYWFVSDAPKHRPRMGRAAWHLGPPVFKDIFFLLALAVTGIISYWLARNITAPIRQLQQATQEISRGDLAARVDARVGKRRDELGELGREFDRMAEQIEKLMSSQKRMLRDVSHELRSPLARLQVALELARKSAGDRSGVEHDRIEKEANRLDTLIGQVLSLVRMTSNGAEVEREPVDMKQLISQVVEDAGFEATSQTKAVKLVSGVDCSIEGDGDLLHSALENIIRNAVRYTDVGTEVEVSMAMPQQNCLSVSVRDRGPGVSEQALEHLFEPFYREAEARDRATGGHGLGLAIAERAIKLHGGDIRASNAEDGGLVMEITIPC